MYEISVVAVLIGMVLAGEVFQEKEDFFVVVVLGILVLLSPFLARQRPRCLIDGCLRATVGVAEVEAEMTEERVEDLVGAEYRPNIRNKSSIFRYRGAYLAYRSSTVR